MSRLALLALLLCFVPACGGAAISRHALEHDAAGAELLAGGDLERAEARFRLALEFAPGLPEARANLGLVALQRGDLVEAEQHLRAAVGLREDFGEAWANLGVVLERRDRDDEARVAYERALGIHPGLVLARANLGWLLARRGALPEARAHLLRLVELAPEDGDAAGLLAWCEMRLGRAEAAREIADGAIARSPEARAPRLVRGVLAAALGHYEEAIAELRLAAEDERLAREARVRLAAIDALSGRPDEALEAMESALRERDEPAARLVAASAALQMERWQVARSHAEAALARRADLDAALLVLADACGHLGDERCAEEALARVGAHDGATAREAARLRAEIGVTLRRASH